jgi:hypothetical protein
MTDVITHVYSLLKSYSKAISLSVLENKNKKSTTHMCIQRERGREQRYIHSFKRQAKMKVVF